METLPKVSVIMAVYNQMDRDALNDAVDSILRQTLKDFEFIIYDDGSVPEAAEYIRKQKEKDPRIRVYGCDKNHGLGFSLNVCAGLTRGKYVARMDADDWAAPDRLEIQYQFLERETQYDWCGCNAFLFDKTDVWGIRKMPESPDARDFLPFSPYIHPSVMYRRELLKRFHYSADEETLRCEDYEIFMRLRQNGFRGYNIQKELLWFREDRDSYRRRTILSRWNETKLRFRGFMRLGILFPFGWFYALRPLLAAALPDRLIMAIKRGTYGYRIRSTASRILQADIVRESGVAYGAGPRQIQARPFDFG